MPVYGVVGRALAVEEGGALGFDEFEIGLAAAGVGDEVEGVAAEAGDDGVVDDAAGGGEEGGEGGGVFGEGVDGRWRDCHEEVFGERAGEFVLDHVRDVEEGGVGACPAVGFGV